MTSSSKFEVRTEVLDTTTRPNGALARIEVSRRLGVFECVVVDLNGVVLTPSFADEFLGVLLVELGEARFRKSIRIVNVADRSRPLLQTVLHRRASKPTPVQSPHGQARACG